MSSHSHVWRRDDAVAHALVRWHRPLVALVHVRQGGDTVVTSDQIGSNIDDIRSDHIGSDITDIESNRIRPNVTDVGSDQTGSDTDAITHWIG